MHTVVGAQLRRLHYTCTFFAVFLLVCVTSYAAKYLQLLWNLLTLFLRKCQQKLINSLKRSNNDLTNKKENGRAKCVFDFIYKREAYVFKADHGLINGIL